MEIFDPHVFRRCCGWKDVCGDIHFGGSHEEYFIVPPSEHLMPDSVPRKARCESCEIEFKRHQGLIRVRRYRINRKQKEILRRYIQVYQASQRGDIILPQKIKQDLYKSIIQNGGTLGQEEEADEATQET